MCIARIKQMNGDLWSVECERCAGEPARRLVVVAPHHGQQAATNAARKLAVAGCANITNEVVLKEVKKPLFGAKPAAT